MTAYDETAKKDLTEDDDLPDQVTLTLEDDTEIVCDVLAIFPCNDKEYIALLPVEDEDSEIFLYRFIENETGEPDLQDIEDDDEYEAVADAFDELLDEDEFDELFEGEDEDEE